jgi:glycosyltransferase involved in cell wall biosynthesis
MAEISFKKHISVCMTSCDGERFIAMQIDSILPQLDGDDELVICDDCSFDSTLSIIRGYKDPRIRLVRNEVRLGVIKNFEKCIAMAGNEIIFLADQDDIWMDDRVKKISGLFAENPETTLVLSNARVIDDSGRVVKDRFLKIYNPVNSGLVKAIKNIVKNNYLGAAIAFRKEMARYILPIPGDVPMHDMWIGILNDIYGRTYYLDEPLIQYRRHSGNLTSDRHSSPGQILKWRIILIRRLVERVMVIAGRGA